MIRDAYCKIRTIDQTIPDDVLDFMKNAAISKLNEVDYNMKLNQQDINDFRKWLKIKQYGKVEICEERKDNKFQVKITGFIGNRIIPFMLIRFINDMVGKKYSIVEKCVTDKDMFDYILKPKQD